MHARRICSLWSVLFPFAAWILVPGFVFGEVGARPDASREALTGREIYERFLENRYRRGLQLIEIVSADVGGTIQTTVMNISVEELRDEKGQPVNGMLGRMMIEVSRPHDMRDTRFLMVSRDPGPDDEFVYRPSERKVKRVALKRTQLLGTDYTFEDLSYHDIDGADYERLDDALVDDTPVYVVESLVNDKRSSEYHRTLSYFEKQHYIPLRVRYWDEFEVEIKEATAEVSTIRLFGSTWVATESAMKNLLERTASTLYVKSIDTDPDFDRGHFSLRRLGQGN